MAEILDICWNRMSFKCIPHFFFTRGPGTQTYGPKLQHWAGRSQGRQPFQVLGWVPGPHVWFIENISNQWEVYVVQTGLVSFTNQLKRFPNISKHIVLADWCMPHVWNIRIEAFSLVYIPKRTDCKSRPGHRARLFAWSSYVQTPAQQFLQKVNLLQI